MLEIGLPVSLHLFILAVEILSSRIRSPTDIKGIKICGTDIKISQLANDISWFAADNTSLQNMLDLKWSLIKLYLNHYILNYKKILKGIDDLLNGWTSRYLILNSNVTAINSLELLKLLYLASVLHTPIAVIKLLRSLVVGFMWNGKPPKLRTRLSLNTNRAV